MDVVRKRCEDVGAELDISEPDQAVFISSSIDGQKFSYPDLGELEIPLFGEYQLKNVSTALKTVEVMRRRGWNISDEAVREGLKKTRWPGRFEAILKDPLFIVDGAHNPHGIRATASSLKSFFKDEKLIFIFGVMADKDYPDMLDQILPMAKEVNCVTPDNPRALHAEKLAQIIEEQGVKATPFPSIEAAVDSALEKAKEEETSAVALGSLYMIGDIKSYIKNRK